MIKWLTLLNALILSIIIGVLVWQNTKQKTGFIVTQRVFASYKGKMELEEKLLTIRRQHKAQLDSLEALIQKQQSSPALIDRYEAMAQDFDFQEQKLSDTFTADIWKRINQEVEAFAKENNYQIIHGATGDGSLMYASGTLEITDEFIEYLNKKY